MIAIQEGVLLILSFQVFSWFMDEVKFRIRLRRGLACRVRRAEDRMEMTRHAKGRVEMKITSSDPGTVNRVREIFQVDV